MQGSPKTNSQTFTPAPFLSRPRHFLRGVVRNVRDSRGTAWFLFLANLRSRHRKAFFGYAWLGIPGIAAALAFTHLRNNAIFSVGDIEVPYPLFVLSGIFLWQTFVDALMTPVNHLKQQSYFLSVVPAPFDGILMAGFLDVLINLSVRCILLICALALSSLPYDPLWLLLPFAMLVMALVGFGLGLGAAPIGLLYDDVGHLLRLLAMFGIFLVPAIYPIPGDSFLALNPLASLMEAARGCMAGGDSLSGIVPALFIAMACLPSGWILLALSRPHLAERAH